MSTETTNRQSDGADGSSQERFVRYLAKWSVVVTLLIILFDLAVIRDYPFPRFLGDAVRGAVYTILSIGLAIASIFLAFLGYRIISLRYVRRMKAIYLIFLPAVVLLTSIIWFLLLAGQS